MTHEKHAKVHPNSLVLSEILLLVVRVSLYFKDTNVNFRMLNIQGMHANSVLFFAFSN